MAQVLFKRGLKANLPSVATQGEPLFTTDTNEMFIGTGSGVQKVTDVAFGTGAPVDSTKLWIDTTNNLIKRFDGSTWVTLSPVQAAASFASLTGDVTDNTALAAAFALKADASTVYTKTAVDTLLAAKADDAATTTALGLKANATDVATSLSAKANTADVTASLALKADASTVYTKSESDTLLAAKADDAATTASLALKADVANVYTKAQVDTKISDIIGTAPAALDTLQEIAAALEGDEATLGGLITTVSGKADTTYVDDQLALKADASAVVVYTASTGLVKSGNDFRIDSSAAGEGLSFASGVISVAVVDGGVFS